MLTARSFPSSATAEGVARWLSELRNDLARNGTAQIEGLSPDPGLLRRLLAVLSTPSQTDVEAARELIAHQLAGSGPLQQRPGRSASPGMFSLPLHRDGALVGEPTDLIAFAAVASPTPGSTNYLDLVDSVAAVKELSAEITTALSSYALEYRVLERGPFPHLPTGWFPRPTFIEYDDHTALNIVLPVAPDPQWPTPWRVRFAELTEGDSRDLLNRLDAELRSSSGFHRHHWVRGEIVIIDNGRVLHGTSAVEPGTLPVTIRAASAS